MIRLNAKMGVAAIVAALFVAFGAYGLGSTSTPVASAAVSVPVTVTCALPANCVGMNQTISTPGGASLTDSIVASSINIVPLTADDDARVDIRIRDTNGTNVVGDAASYSVTSANGITATTPLGTTTATDLSVLNPGATCGSGAIIGSCITNASAAGTSCVASASSLLTSTGGCFSGANVVTSSNSGSTHLGLFGDNGFTRHLDRTQDGIISASVYGSTTPPITDRKAPSPAPTTNVSQDGGAITPPNTGDAGLADASGSSWAFVLAGAVAFGLAGVASVKFARR